MIVFPHTKVRWRWIVRSGLGNHLIRSKVVLVPRPHLDALQAREAEWPTGTSHRKLNPGTTRRVQSGAQRSDPRR